MNTQNQRSTAQILQFPPPGARIRGDSVARTYPKQKAEILEGTVSTYGAWYHEAAITETDRLRKP
jgi:hypothetical protein